MVVLILEIVGVWCMAAAVCFNPVKHLKLKLGCLITGAVLMNVAFILHGLWWAIVLFAIEIPLCALAWIGSRRAKRRTSTVNRDKISPLTWYYAQERLRQPPGKPGIGPRRWPM